jgi:CHASE3 domain sensor protein
MKLTIYRKLLLSYLAMALLTVLASAYAIYSLRQLNELAVRVIHDDVAVVDVSKKLLDTLISWENAEKRYLILRDPSIEEIFRTRSREFADGLSELGKSRFAGVTGCFRRTTIRDLTERLHAETAALVQENDQLKKDL